MKFHKQPYIIFNVDEVGLQLAYNSVIQIFGFRGQ